MKLTDYLIEALVHAGVKTVFGVTGGSIVHPLHSAEKSSQLDVVYTHHEQAAGFAADAVAHFEGQVGACFVTTGPGGTNAITGLTSAWLDSVPVIFVSGQARSEHLTGPNTVRQIGSQHIDIISVVRPLTKFAKTIESPLDARKVIEEAIYLCTSGRPGPVWIDIPLDIQWSEIDPSNQLAFIPEHSHEKLDSFIDIEFLVNALRKAKKPLIVAGFGIKSSGMTSQFLDMLSRIEVPCVFTWNTLDLLSSESELNLGLLGTAGSREANLAAHCSDLIIAVGSHLSNQLIGNDPAAFAPNAVKFVIDIDRLELDRLPNDFHKINSDLKIFLPQLSSMLSKFKFNSLAWKKQCEEFRGLRNYGVPIHKSEDRLWAGQYFFYKEISKIFKKNDTVVVDGGGNTLFSALNSLRLTEGQHIISGAGIGCMGSGLPHAIGAAYASTGGNIYCFIGDGSMQFNIQELATIKLLELPIKIILINNGGYRAIKDTQDNFFDRRFGVDLATGISFPSYREIARAYEIEYCQINTDDDVLPGLNLITSGSSPYICEVFVDPDAPLLPRAGFVKLEDGSTARLPTYDMFPTIPRDEMKRYIP